MKKKKPKKASAKAVMQSLFGPTKGISVERVVPLKNFQKRLEKRNEFPSRGLLSPEEDDFRHRHVNRPNESRAWARRKLG